MAKEEKQTPPAVQQPSPSEKVVSPTTNSVAFCCPHCGVYTHQFWYTVLAKSKEKDSLPFLPNQEFMARFDAEGGLEKDGRAALKRFFEKHLTGKVFFRETESGYSNTEARNLHLSKCYTCNEIAVWVYDRLVFPPHRNGPNPNEDIPEDIKTDFEEARSILSLSPRGAAALLRLCVEKLAIHLKAKGGKLDARIADLVAKGLDVRVQRALDTVRVIGNEAVHPGQMDLKDNKEIAETLFRLVNVIVEKTISEPSHVAAIYKSLPESKRKAIENRDKGKP